MIPGINSNVSSSMSSSNVVFVFVWTLGDLWICSFIAKSMLQSIADMFSKFGFKHNVTHEYVVPRFALDGVSKMNPRIGSHKFQTWLQH